MYQEHRKKTQIISLSVAALFFAAALYGMITGQDKYLAAGLILLGAVFIAGIIFSLTAGRIWCGWLCPRGSFLDNILSKFSRNKTLPGFLKDKEPKHSLSSLDTAKIGITALLTIMFTNTLLGNNPFIQTDNIFLLLGGFLVFVCIATTILFSVPLGLIYKPRAWCSFCPMGAAQSILAKNKILNIQTTDNCRQCGACHKACPLEISEKHPLTQILTDPACINCMKCVDACPINARRPVLTPI